MPSSGTVRSVTTSGIEPLPLKPGAELLSGIRLSASRSSGRIRMGFRLLLQPFHAKAEGDVLKYLRSFAVGVCLGDGSKRSIKIFYCPSPNRETTSRPKH